MESRAETRSAKTRGQHARDLFRVWNRKAHYYLGLYFLFFLWLFAFTGLLLNHSWKFAEFWPNRTVTTFEKPVRVENIGNDLERARAVMLQIGIDGEIEWTATRLDSSVFAFRATRPGRSWQITVNAEMTRAVVEQTGLNVWGVMRILHTFTGVRAGDSRNRRDWILTTAWALCMDAVAIGLALMVFGGIYLWIGIPSKRRLGAAALLAGTLTCLLFLVGLRLIY